MFSSRSDEEILVRFSCSLGESMVKPSEDDCKITIHKKKWNIVGQQILPLCKIVISKLKPFTENLDVFWEANEVHYRLFPLESHKAVVDILSSSTTKEPKQFDDNQNLTSFRRLLCILFTQQRWDVSIINVLNARYRYVQMLKWHWPFEPWRSNSH